VHEVLSTGVVLDGNHELAWKDLIFDITIVSIK
jgi:FKBP-type peptidyl-prolyl cis-trans isomerase 2